MRRLIAALLVVSISSPVLAWGPQGHKIITRVATARLTPAASKAVRELLNPGDTLVDICDWADHDGHDVVPGSASWHYVNVPIGDSKYEDRHSPRSGSVVTKIGHYRKVLSDKSASRRDRQLALLFLVHFVEDIHQPLHVGDNHDRGGNDTQIQFDGRGTNLHALWDSGLIRHIDRNENHWTERIDALLTPAHVKEWSSLKVEDWANESLSAAKRAYDWPVGSKTPIHRGASLDDDYARHVEPILLEQMAKGSVRLADELNAIFK
jgi:hypothetical protein